MKGKDVSDALNGAPAQYIDGSKPKNRKKKKGWIAAVAAVLAVTLTLGVLYIRGGKPQNVKPVPGALKAYAVGVPEYPKNVPYPSSDLGNDDWYNSVARRVSFYGAGEGLEPFYFSSAAAVLLSAENAVYSPFSAYLALAMLAELTDGNTRAQILEALRAESMEALRTQANAVWNANYFNDGATISVPADSVWLSDSIDYNKDTLDVLARDYYAASFSGEFGNKNYDTAVQKWINAQTGDLLKEAAAGVKFPPETVVGLISALCFRAKWADTFSASDTAPGTFYAEDGTETADFMHQTVTYGRYYYGERFGAVSLNFKQGCKMTFILPDEGVSPNAVLRDEEACAFLCAAGTDSALSEYEKSAFLRINLSVPKFDVSSNVDLKEMLAALGIRDCFDASLSDFSPLTGSGQPVVLTEAKQSARVAVDEEGVTAAVFTELVGAGAAMPPEDEMDFTLDRPFLFLISGFDGAPLFIGTVFHVQ